MSTTSKKSKKKEQPLVQLDVLGSRHGHESEVISIEDNKPERRAELAEHVNKLIKSGFAIMLGDGTKVVGFDPETSSWLVKGKTQKPEKISAQGNKATAMAPVVGG